MRGTFMQRGIVMLLTAALCCGTVSGVKLPDEKAGGTDAAPPLDQRQGRRLG